MNNITQWQHFKKNYMGTFIFMMVLFVTALILEISRDSDTWYLSFFFFIIGAVILPIGNYLSWKKKFKS